MKSKMKKKRRIEFVPWNINLLLGKINGKCRARQPCLSHRRNPPSSTTARWKFSSAQQTPRDVAIRFSEVSPDTDDTFRPGGVQVPRSKHFPGHCLLRGHPRQTQATVTPRAPFGRCDWNMRGRASMRSAGDSRRFFSGVDLVGTYDILAPSTRDGGACHLDVDVDGQQKSQRWVCPFLDMPRHPLDETAGKGSPPCPWPPAPRFGVRSRHSRNHHGQSPARPQGNRRAVPLTAEPRPAATHCRNTARRGLHSFPKVMTYRCPFGSLELGVDTPPGQSPSPPSPAS